MTPEEASLLHDGLRIAAVHQRGDSASEEQLLQPFLRDDRFPRLADAFIYVTLFAAEFRATGASLPFQEALQSITPRTDVILLPGLPIGSWDEAILLASAVKRSGEEARRTHLSMDVPSAINITFQLAVSALSELTAIPQFQHMSVDTLADEFANAIEEGHANG